MRPNEDYIITEADRNNFGVPPDQVFQARKLPNGGFLCNFCSKFMKFKGDMRRHIRTHTGEKLFPCSICGKSFKQKAHMNFHMRTVHRDII